MDFWKLLLNKFVTGSLKNPCPSAPNLPENLKNILGVGGRHKPNIFPITAKYLEHLDPCCISQALFIIRLLKIAPTKHLACQTSSTFGKPHSYFIGMTLV